MANSSIDDNRTHSLLAISSVVSTTDLALTATPISGVNPLNVAIVDGSGSQITSFGGGTQYTDGGAAVVHPVGTAIIYQGTANAPTVVSAANPLPVSASISLSNYAQETGGNLATVVTDLGTIDSDLKANITLHAGTNVIGKVSQDTSPWVVSGAVTNTVLSVVGGGTEATAQRVTIASDSTGVLSVDDNGGSLTVDGVFYQTTQPVSIASAQVASGAFASGSIANGAIVTLGAEADARSTATDTTAITAMQVLKEISYMEQNPASRAVTGTVTANISGSISNTSFVATQGTASNLLAQVTNGGTFAVQSTNQTQTDTVMIGGVNIKEINAVTPLMGAGNGGTGSLRVNLASDEVALPTWGHGATAAGVPSGATYVGAQAISAEVTARTNAYLGGLTTDLVGKLITSPHANKENFISGVASATTATDTAVIAAQGAGVYIYITSISVANTGATASLVTIETDTASAKTAIWYMINPAGGGDNITFDPPLRISASNKNVGFATGSASTTQYCSIAGYIGS